MNKIKECEFCGIKEHCNNYKIGLQEARKEFLDFLSEIYSEPHDWFKRIDDKIKELKQALAQKEKTA